MDAESPKNSDEGGRVINATFKITPEMLREIDDIARDTKRSRSQIGYLLLDRALRLYRQDGELFETVKEPERSSRPRIVR